MAELYHECGIAAVYWLGEGDTDLAPIQGGHEASRLIPRLLIDIQNRGQLAAGISSYNADRKQLLDTHREVGTVSEVFQMNHQDRFEALMEEYSGPAAICHVRYST